MAALGVAVMLAASASPVLAQGTNGREGQVWRLEALHEGFCVEFLVEPAAVARELPRGTAPLPAGPMSDLHPALRGVVQSQPEYAAWAPSQLCLFYFLGMDAQGRRIRETERHKLPLLGFWTVAVADSLSRDRRDVALEVLTNNGRLERSARDAGLHVRRIRSSIGPAPADDEGNPSEVDRYEFRVGKTQLTWDGRPGTDSVRSVEPLVRRWRVEGRRGGWVTGSLNLTTDWTRAMIGSLKVEGKDDLARLLKDSPTRFVGPAYQGGAGTFQFGR